MMQQNKIVQIPLPPEPDSTAILKVLEDLRLRYSRDPVVWQTALRLVERTGNNAQMQQADRLAAYVREKMIYVKDPDSGEFVTAPNVLIERINARGFAQGDCDDHALLLNSLLGAVGIETRFAGVQLPNTSQWNHVVSNLRINGQWYDLDTCSKKGTRVIYSQHLTVR